MTGGCGGSSGRGGWDPSGFGGSSRGRGGCDGFSSIFPTIFV